MLQVLSVIFGVGRSNVTRDRKCNKRLTTPQTHHGNDESAMRTSPDSAVNGATCTSVAFGWTRAARILIVVGGTVGAAPIATACVMRTFDRRLRCPC